MPDPERQRRLQQAMTTFSVQGQITPLGPYQFQLHIPGSQVPHVLYLLLSVLTLGLWLPVWLFHVMIAKGDRLHVIAVDEYGGVWHDRTVWWPPPAVRP